MTDNTLKDFNQGNITGLRRFEPKLIARSPTLSHKYRLLHDRLLDRPAEAIRRQPWLGIDCSSTVVAEGVVLH
jgi:hypothetical protein